MFDWDEVDMDEMLQIRDDAAAYLEQTDYIPAETFARTKKLLAEYRNLRDAQPDNKPEQAPVTAK